MEIASGMMEKIQAVSDLLLGSSEPAEQFIEDLEVAMRAVMGDSTYNEKEYHWNCDSELLQSDLCAAKMNAWMRIVLTTNYSDEVHFQVIRLVRWWTSYNTWDGISTISSVTAGLLAECGLFRRLLGSVLKLSNLTVAAQAAAFRAWRRVDSDGYTDLMVGKYFFRDFFTDALSAAECFDLLDAIGPEMMKHSFLYGSVCAILDKFETPIPCFSSEFFAEVVKRCGYDTATREGYQRLGRYATEWSPATCLTLAAPHHLFDVSCLSGREWHDEDMIADRPLFTLKGEDCVVWWRVRCQRIYALIVLASDDPLLKVCDDVTLLVSRGRVLRVEKIAALKRAARFFRIATRLPLELQAVLAYRTLGQLETIMPEPEKHVWRWALNLWCRPS